MIGMKKNIVIQILRGAQKSHITMMHIYLQLTLSMEYHLQSYF